MPLAWASHYLLAQQLPLSLALALQTCTVFASVFPVLGLSGEGDGEEGSSGQGKAAELDGTI